MSGFVLCAAVLALLAVALLTRPLWWGASAPRDVAGEGAGSGSADTRSRGLAAALLVFIAGVGAAGYATLGAPQHLGLGPDSAAAAAAPAATAASASAAQQQFAAMVEQLAQRLKAHPDDAEGWQVLARSYVMLGQPAQAVEAFRKAVSLRPDDAPLLADFAVTLANSSERRFEGEPTRLVERALKADPRHPKALAMAGAIAFDRQDYAGAVRYWETLARTQPADSPIAAQLRESIAEARQRAGMPPPADTAAAPSGAPAAPTGGPATAGRVSGTVTLSPALKARAAPDDTVFVFARAAQGPRMPLAILRKRVSDLPLQFTLDDSLSMSPAAPLSGAGRVVVGARISKSGQALAQPGDLHGSTPAVEVGASGLTIEINDVVGR
jgi:cytochrome c-type biogenesis protein CcmH